jgi:hypothetical protein
VKEAQADWAAPLPRRRSDRLRALAPVLLLLVIAVVGVRNHIVRDQSSWQGVTFGMFATYENNVSREVVVTVDRGDGPERVSLPDSLDDDVRRLEVVPTDGAAASLARSVLDLLDGPADVDVTVRKIVLTGDDPLELRYGPLATGTASR